MGDLVIRRQALAGLLTAFQMKSNSPLISPLEFFLFSGTKDSKKGKPSEPFWCCPLPPLGEQQKHIRVKLAQYQHRHWGLMGKTPPAKLMYPRVSPFCCLHLAWSLSEKKLQEYLNHPKRAGQKRAGMARRDRQRQITLEKSIDSKRFWTGELCCTP